MNLPNGDRAVVDVEKLRNYCLNPTHPRGRHKARVFASTLGWTANDAGRLRDVLLAAACEKDSAAGEKDEYGQRYTLDLVVPGPHGPVPIRSLWIVAAGEDFPRLASCFVL
jgi:hypothetical protein